MSTKPRLRLLGLTVGACLLSPAVSAQETAPTAEPAATAAAAPTAETDSLTQALQNAPKDRISHVRGATGPQAHKVRSGDTLWDITNRYLHDPYLWPAVWSQNPHISNPHWIFPGDIVYLRDAQGNDLFGLSSQPGITTLYAGYYTDEELDKAGRIMFSPEEKSLLTHLDEAYVNWKDEQARKEATPGRRYAIYRKLKPALDSESGDPIAQKVQLVGTLDIIYNDGQTLPTATITNAYLEISRGDLLLPFDTLLARVTPSPNGAEAQGRIMDVFEVLTQLGEQQYVLLDRGQDDGVQVGNRFMVFEQREGLKYLEPRELSDEEEEQKEKEEEALENAPPEEQEARKRENRTWRNPDIHTWPLGGPPQAKPPLGLEEEDLEADAHYHSINYHPDDLPKRLIGEIIVLQTNKRFSTGLITQSVREININHPVRLLQGY